MPEILDGQLDLGFELQFRWGRDQYLQWVRKGVLGSSLAETGKPGVWDRVLQHIHGMLVEGVVRPMHGYHMQQSELVLVEQSWSWERTREKVYSWGWGVGMQALKSLEGATAVKGENLQVHWE